MIIKTACASLLATIAIAGVSVPALAGVPDGAAIVKSTCGSCHTLAPGKGAAEGPNLFGVVGRKAGTAPGYAYSDAFRKALAGKVWTPEMLDRWLTDTDKAAPGTTMTYFNDDKAARAAIIRYLGTMK